MRIEPFKASHLERMSVQAAQLGEMQYLSPAMREGLGAFPSFSGFQGGDLIACAGMVDCRFMWAILSDKAAPHMLSLTRIGLRILSLYPDCDVETHVSKNFKAGCRWLTILGFQVERALPHFGPDGSDHWLYRRPAWAG